MFARELAWRLRVMPGITAVIGSGGKTALLRTLAEGLPGTILLCTTTHIYPFPDFPLMEAPSRDELRAAFREHRIICAGTPEPGTGKLTALPYDLSGLANYVLVEADGAAGMPLKGHRPGEPVIPPEAQWVIQVVGMTGLGQMIGEAVHCPEYFAQFGSQTLAGTVTPSLVAKVLNHENLANMVLLNQADHCRHVANLMRAMLNRPAIIASIQERWLE